MCRVLGVSRSGDYRWSRRTRPSAREVADGELVALIQEIHEDSRHTYGSPRVHHELKRRGVTASMDRVARLMRQHGIRGRVRRRYRATTDSNHRRPVAANLLGREFEQEVPDSAWCADITSIATASGWVYLAAVIDLATRMVVGWSMATHMRTELVVHALENALATRDPAPSMIHHSDRGSQYASGDDQRLLEAKGITCSMSRKGDCWDNAVMESFFGTYKQECAHVARWQGLDDARRATVDYIDVFYNRKRLHSSLGYRTPAEADAVS